MQPKYKIGSAPRACRSFASTFVASVCPSKRKDLAMCKPMVYQSNIDRHENTSVKQFDYVQLLLCSPNQFYVSRCVGCMTVVQLVCLTRMHTTSSVAESSLWSAHNINCSLLSPTRRNRNWMTVIPYDIWFNLWSSLGSGNGIVRQRNLSSLWPRFPNIKLQRLGMTQLLRIQHKKEIQKRIFSAWMIHIYIYIQIVWDLASLSSNICSGFQLPLIARISAPGVICGECLAFHWSINPPCSTLNRKARSTNFRISRSFELQKLISEIVTDATVTPSCIRVAHSRNSPWCMSF